MILNISSRTDIPAYFSEWFYERVREGYVCVRNPYYETQVTRYRLNPAVVDCLVFWTKNPAPMLSRIGELDAFGQYWFVTITPYGREIEPHVPSMEQVMESFLALSEKVGSRAICWRYDPIFLTEKYSLDFHREAFEKMAERLSGSTEVCVISFIDLYEKTLRNFKGVKAVRGEERREILKDFTAIGKKYGIRIKTCAEGEEPAAYGADVRGCLTKEVLERALGESLHIKTTDRARTECACLLGNDIGAYNICGHGCLYCYANYDAAVVAANVRKHDVHSPFLIGGAGKADIVKDAGQENFRDGQLRMFWES